MKSLNGVCYCWLTRHNSFKIFKIFSFKTVYLSVSLLSVCLSLILPRNKKSLPGVSIFPSVSPASLPLPVSLAPAKQTTCELASLPGSRSSSPGLKSDESPLLSWRIFLLALRQNTAVISGYKQPRVFLFPPCITTFNVRVLSNIGR